MNEKPLFSKILQIFIVVDDVDRYVRTYQDTYGIGPWSYLDFSDAAVPHKTVRGKPGKYQLKLAVCDSLNVNLALIQPLDEHSIFAQHLRTKGPGLHHLLVTGGQSYEESLSTLQARGNQAVQGGTTANGLEYSYVDASRDLGMVIELLKLPATAA
jgi:methylmalonyl-CoA/ethylmalonyl-CoA epimerase